MKKPVFLIMLTTFLAVAFLQLNGQKLIRQSINSLSSGASSNGLYLNQTVGQPFSTKSVKDSETFFNPGFQQAIILRFSKPEPEDHFSDLIVYPNPASNEINVRSEVLNKVQVKVTDMAGRVVFMRQETHADHFRINSSAWQNGLYIITLFDSRSQHIETTRLLISK